MASVFECSSMQPSAPEDPKAMLRKLDSLSPTERVDWLTEQLDSARLLQQEEWKKLYRSQKIADEKKWKKQKTEHLEKIAQLETENQELQGSLQKKQADTCHFEKQKRLVRQHSSELDLQQVELSKLKDVIDQQKKKIQKLQEELSAGNCKWRQTIDKVVLSSPCPSPSVSPHKRKPGALCCETQKAKVASLTKKAGRLRGAATGLQAPDGASPGREAAG